MPKSSKHKKERAADFSKAKLKLGKGKAPANNAVDTSFKARSIVLPNQRITTTQGDFTEPTTKRNLTIHDLLAQLKHYNVNVRNEAILGLRELLDAHWFLVDAHLSTLLISIVRLIGDEDASVRKQLLSFMGWLLPRVPEEDILPHSSTLLLFTTSAQTHIFPEIRIDAVRFIDIFLASIPSATVSGWYDKEEKHGNRVLNGYLGILSAGTKFGDAEGPMKATSTASVTLTPGSKLVVLRSLFNFLNCALAFDRGQRQRQESEALQAQAPNCWYMKDAFSSPAAHARFERLFDPSSSSSIKNASVQRWDSGAESSTADTFGHMGIASYALFDQTTHSTSKDQDDEPWCLQDLDMTTLEDEAAKEKESSLGGHSALASFVSHLSNVLHSTLIDTYLDLAPSVFSPSGSTPSDAEVNLILTVCRLVKTLYHVLSQSSDVTDFDVLHTQHLESITGYMHPYFPAHSQDHKVDQLFEEFNLIFCELTSLLVKVNSNLVGEGSRSARRRKVDGAQRQLPPGTSKDRRKYRQSEKQVTQYILDRLRSSIPGNGGSGPSATGQPLSPTAYAALLPSIWMNINRRAGPFSDDDDDEGRRQQEVLSATLDHAVKITSKSACKRLTIEFIGRLVMLSTEPNYRGHFRLEREGAAGLNSPSSAPGLDVKAKMDAWILHLPQVLWELGSSQLRTTETILRVLLRFLQRQARVTPDQVKMMVSLQSRLLPYFEIKHPSRGVIAGPYSKLPPASLDSVSNGHRLRFLVLDVVKSLSSFGKAEEDPARGGKGAFAQAVRKAVSQGEEITYLDNNVVT